MEFPQRPEQHVKETESYKILESALPSEWLVRRVTDMDYGIDVYLELTSGPKGQDLRGDLCFLQVKSTQNISWDSDNLARLHGIKKSTVNYWMNSPLPVFLLWVDLSERKVYFLPVQSYLRLGYQDYLKAGETMSFLFHRDLSLKPLALINLYVRDRYYSEFEHNARALFARLGESWKFLYYNLGSDGHMAMDYDKELHFRHLYETTHRMAQHLRIEWPVPSLNELYDMDRESFGEDSSTLHWHSFDQVVEPMLPVFLDVAEAAAALIDSQTYYWLERDRALLNFCGNVHHQLRDMRAELAGA